MDFVSESFLQALIFCYLSISLAADADDSEPPGVLGRPGGRRSGSSWAEARLGLPWTLIELEHLRGFFISGCEIAQSSIDFISRQCELAL